MATQMTMWSVEEILRALKKQAKEGSCKTCKWCAVIPDAQHNELPGHTHYCMIQGNPNAIEFTPELLDSKPYPCKCKEGRWYSNHEPIPECLAYQPGHDGLLHDAPGLAKAANQHRQFMVDLAEAARLDYAIREGKLAKLLEKLNASESVPHNK